MNILNPEIIKQEEQRLLLAIENSLDLNATREMFQKQSGIEPIDNTEIQSRDIIVFESQIAFKLMIEARFAFYLLIDRFGNFLELENRDHEPIDRPSGQESAIPLADPDIIQKSEKEIIEKISATLEEKQIKELFEQKFNSSLGDEIELKSGNMIIHQNKIIYRLNYDTRLKFELLLDQSGNHLTPKIVDENSRTDDPIQTTDSFGAGLYDDHQKIG